MKTSVMLMTILGGDPYKGYSYYVDSATGSDSNTGTSSLSPFATIAKLLTVWQAGQSVGVKADGHLYREEVLLPGNNSKLYWYGGTNKPIFDASDIALNASFTKTAGRTNVYEISVTFSAARTGETAFSNVWEDDVFMPLVADVATCDTTPGSHFIAAHTGTQTLYVHASNSSDVTTNGKVYTWSKRWAGVYGYDYSGCVLQGVRCQKNRSQNGSIVVGQSATLTDCDAYFGNKHNIYMRAGSNASGCTAQDAWYNSSATMFVINDNTPNGENSTLTNCTAIMTNTLAQTVTGFYGHRNTSGTYGTITYNSCIVNNLTIGFDMLNAAALVVNSPSVTNCRTTAQSSGVSLTVASPTIVGGRVGTQERIIEVISGTSPVTLTGVTMTGATLNAMIGILSTQANVVTVQNCNFNASTFTGISRIISLSSASAKLIADHNTYPAGGWQTTYFTSALANDADHFVSDYNSFGDDSQDIRVGGVTYSSVATYKAATGQDAHSTIP